MISFTLCFLSLADSPTQRCKLVLGLPLSCEDLATTTLNEIQSWR